MHTLDEWRSDGEYFTHNGFSIFYRTGTGRGEPLLLIHGFPTASWDWHRVWDQLAEDHMLIAPDMIGFGFSDKPPLYPYHIIDQAELHEALLRKLQLGKVHILAHDYGVSVAQELLARYEARKKTGDPGPVIQSVCFLNGGLFPETHRPLLIQRLLLSPLGPLVSSLSTERIAKKRFFSIFGPDTKPTEAEWRDFWSLTTHNGGKKILHHLIRYMTDRRENRERWVGAMQATEVPMRLINGPEDPVSGEHLAARFTELIPHADVTLLPGIGHYPQVEDPKGVLNSYRSFRQKID